VESCKLRYFNPFEFFDHMRDVQRRINTGYLCKYCKASPHGLTIVFNHPVKSLKKLHL
jgi:hypothetical protein